MDINTSYLTNTIQNADKSAEKAKALSSRDYSKATDDELMDVCKQFEAYFIEQVLKEVKKTVPETTAFGQDASTSSMVDYFMDSTIQRVSENIQENAGLGLAQQMYEQMKRNYSIPDAADDTKTAKAPDDGMDAAS